MKSPTSLSSRLLLAALAAAALPVVRAVGGGIDPRRPLQHQKSDIVVKLVDSNFEHQTQASTGMTTGSWLLWFYDTGDKTVIGGAESAGEGAEATKPAILEDSFWTDHNLVLGVVHVTLGRDTVKRFGIDPSGDRVPCFVFLKKGKFYRFDGPFEWDAISAFALGGYESTEGQKIPPPPGHLSKLVELMRETVLGHIVLAGLVVVLFAFIFYTVAVTKLLNEEKKAKAA